MRYPDRRSKIVCTIGPSVHSYEAIQTLIEKGMDVARLNFSHGTHDQHRQTVEWIREASKKLKIYVAILGDLQGPKIRTGRLLTPPATNNEGKIFLPLKAGQEIYFTGIEVGIQQPGNGSAEKPITISYPRLALDLKAGDSILFDDGLARARVKKVIPEKNLVLTAFEYGDTLGENKGANMPEARLTTLGVTEKDWEDVLFALTQNIDFLALSFVRTAREIRHLKEFLDKKKANLKLIAKIEKREAIDNIDDILIHSDGIMVARGDLGIEIGNEHVPIVQKQLIQKARQIGKPVITATQMLMSMVSNPSPSRAEASDVANAVLDGSDALMLSNETASGKYPFESVETMSTIIKGAETLTARDYVNKGSAVLASSQNTGKSLPISEAIEAAATSLAGSLNARCIATLTRSGQAARLLAKYRPPVPIYAFAENEKVRNQLSLSWGVYVIPWMEMKHLGYTVFDDLLKEMGSLGLMKNGDLAVMTAGIPTSLQVGTTNSVVVRSYPPPEPEQT